MPDIFGRERTDYAHIRAIDEQLGTGAWERSQEQMISRASTENQGRAINRHDFDSLGRAAGDNGELGYLTNNLMAIQSVADEILYTEYRLPDFISLNNSIPEGADTYAVRVRDRRGKAERVSAPGYDAPSATVNQTLVTQQMHYYGLDAIWSVDELRGAMFAGIPLDTESIDAAIRGLMETMEAVGLTGGDYPEKGLLNQPVSGTNKVGTADAAKKWDGASVEEIRTDIHTQLSNVIEDSKETIGRNINTGMTIYLPGEQYDLLSYKYVGNDARMTLLGSILKDNPWTNFTNRPLNIVRVLELTGILSTAVNTDSKERMITALKSPRVAEMGVSINPRILKILDKGRGICAQCEAKFSPLFVKRPSTIRYLNGI